MFSMRRPSLVNRLIVAIVLLSIIVPSTPALAVTLPSVDVTSSDPAYASGAVTVDYTLNGISGGNAWLAVKNSTGSIIRMVNGGPVSGSGPHSITWDGKDGSGNPVLVGTYTLLVAVNRSGLEYVGEWGGKSVAYPQAWGIAINSTGYAYVTDSLNSNVIIYDPAGNFVRVFGSAGSAPGQLYCPGNPAINSTDYVFIADYSNKRLEIFDINGGYVGEINYTSGPGKFVGPGDVAINSTGHIYVTDYEGHNVKVFSPSWTYEYSIGNGTAGADNGQFNYPNGIVVDTVDASDRVYVADGDNDRVQVFDRNGAFLFSFDSTGSSAGKLNCPNGITINSTGYIYVADGYNNRVQVFDSTGAFSYVFGSSGAGNGQFNYPYGIAVNSSGFVYVVDNGNGRVEVFDRSGAYSYTLGPANAEYGKFYYPTAVTVGPSGQVYVVDNKNSRVQVFNQFGDFLFAFGSKGTGDGQFSEVYGIAVNSSGYIYIAEYNNHRVQVFDPSGNYFLKFGVEGTGDGQFGTLWDIAVNSTDYVFVGDFGNHFIHVFDAMGNYKSEFNDGGIYFYMWSPTGIAFNSTDFVYAVDNYNQGGHPVRVCVYNTSNRYQFEYGTNGSDDGQFYVPYGIAIDPLGFTYVADCWNQRIQMFTPTGAFVSKIGAWGTDGGSFSSPYDVAVGNSGAVYVADMYNNRIQVLSYYVIADVTLIVERTPPSISSTSPVNGDTHVSTGDHITATLSEPASASTVNSTTFYVYPTSSPSSHLSGTFSVSGNDITFIPDAPLTGGVAYTATVTTGVTDRAGNAISSTYSWSFTVEDTVPPTIVSTSPSDGETGVSVDADIIVVFSEPVKSSSVNSYNFFMYSSSSPDSHVSGTILVSDETVTFTPDSSLDDCTTFEVSVLGNITDMAGNEVGTDDTWSFTTEDLTPPSIVSTSPDDGDVDVSVLADVVATFSEPVDPSTVNSSSFYVRFASDPASRVDGTISVVGDSITFDPADSLDDDTEFVGHISGSVTDIAGNEMGSNYEWSFTTEDLTPPSIVSRSPSDGETYVSVLSDITVIFSEAVDPSTVGSSSFYVYPVGSPGDTVSGSITVVGDNATFNPTGPLDDCVTYDVTVAGTITDVSGNALGSDDTWSFTTEDLTPPSIVSTSPDDGDVDVSVLADVVATFSEPVDPSTVNSSSFYVRLASDPASRVDGTISVVGDSITFDPADPLDDDTEFVGHVSGSVTDIAGNALGTDHEWSFMTEDLTPPSIVSRSPSDGEIDVSVLSDVVVTFSEPVDSSTIDSSSFYMYPAGSPGDTVSGSFTVVGDSITFDPADPLDDCVTYYVTVAGTITDVSGNALGSDDTWSFATEDITPPALISTAPADGDVDVSINADIIVTFSEAVDPLTIDSSSFYVRLASDPASRVDGTISVVGDSITFDPADPLDDDAEFVCHVSGSITDIAGNELGSDHEWSFKTEDLTPPTIVSTSIPDGATNINVSTNFTVAFSEPVDPSTVNNSSFYMHPSSNSSARVACTVATTGNETVLTPLADLNKGTEYMVNVSASITDLSGNALGSSHSWSFRTVPYNYHPPPYSIDWSYWDVPSDNTPTPSPTAEPSPTPSPSQSPSPSPSPSPSASPTPPGETDTTTYVLAILAALGIIGAAIAAYLLWPRK